MDNLEEIDTLTKLIKSLAATINDLRIARDKAADKRQQLIDAEVSRSAHIKLGQIVEAPYGATMRAYRITKIDGAGYDRNYWPRFYGVLLRQDGSDGAINRRLTGISKVYPLAGEPSVTGYALENLDSWQKARSEKAEAQS